MLKFVRYKKRFEAENYLTGRLYFESLTFSQNLVTGIYEFVRSGFHELFALLFSQVTQIIDCANAPVDVVDKHFLYQVVLHCVQRPLSITSNG